MPETVICTYRVKPGNEETFEELLRRHWPTLHEYEVVTEEPARAYRGIDGDKRPYYVEIFEWLDGGFGRVHELPAIGAIWERMEALCEKRGDLPACEFPHFQPVDLTA